MVSQRPLRPILSPQRVLPRESRWIVFVGIFLLIAGIFAAYHRTLHVPFLLDDIDSIETNSSLRSFATAFFPDRTTGATVSGRPLLNFSLAINYALGGTRVEGYHLGNLLIHFLASLCLWGVVRRTLLRPKLIECYETHATALAWFAAALWALHPLQTESVTYTIQRAESLAGFFYLLTLYAFIRSLEESRPGWSATTVVVCFLGMASKETMASAPLVLLLYDYAFVSGSFRESLRLRRKLYLGLASSWVLLLLLVASTKGRGGSVGFAQVTWWEYAFTQATAILRYLWLTIWPTHLVFDHGTVVEKDPRIFVPCVLALTTLIVGTCLTWKKWPELGFLGASFFLILAPSSSVVPIVTQTMAEHRFYLPLAALSIATVLVLYRQSTNLAGLLLPLLVVALIVTTHARNEVYRNKSTIWEDTLRKVPNNVRALDNLGAIYFEAGQTERAISCFGRALELNPEYASAQSNYGQALLRAGRHEEGLKAIETALRLSPERAAYHVAEGNAYLDLQQPERAVRSIEKATALEPDNGNYHYDLANALTLLDRNEEAEQHFLAALQVKPKDVETLNNYGTLLRRLNRDAEAIAYLEVALQLAPQSARVRSNLGVSFLKNNRVDEGIEQLREAVRLEPGLAQARYNLANALVQTGRASDAIQQLEALREGLPLNAELHSHLGALYAQVGRLKEAQSSLRKALEIDPKNEAARDNLNRITLYLAP